MSDKRVDVVLSDVHGLFRDKRAIDAALRVAERVECNRIVLNGDMVDFPTISKFAVDPARLQAWSVTREAKSMMPFWQTIDEMSPEAPVYLCGNHEHRWGTYLMFQAPQVHELYKADLRNVLRVPERWSFMRYRAKLRIGDLSVTHGSKPYSEVPGQSALGHLKKHGRSILIGHTHRLAQVAMTTDAGTFFGYEQGHLSDPKPHYAEDGVSWQQGFAVVSTIRGRAAVELVPIQNGKALFRGDVI